MSRIVEVVTYNPDWPRQFIAEASKIKEILGDNCIVVHHIGSTSIPGLAAKPILDMLPVVKDILKLNTEGLESLGYIARGELGMPFRRFYNRGEPQRTHHLHIWEQDNPEIEKHLLFRNYIIAHPKEMKRYAEIKHNLALSFKNDRKKYTLSKDLFIRNIVFQSGFEGLTIVQALHEKEWQEYHRIRKAQIFDRLPHIVYDPNHPTITDQSHYHFVLMKGVEIIAIAQVEMLDMQTAALRALATDQKYQGHGYGTYLLNLLESWIAQQRKTKVLMHAPDRAENFYRNRGYIDMEFNDVGISENHVDLGKDLI